MTTHKETPEPARKTLLVCGILSSLVYVVMNVVGAMRWPGYSSISQTISELGAIAAPSRSAVVPIGVAYQALMIAFAVGVWRSAGEKRSLRLAAVWLFAYGLVGLTAPFTPMHMRGQTPSLSDTLHIVGTVVAVAFMLLAMVFSAIAFGKSFRVYSAITVVAMLLFGAWAGLDGPRIAANLPTPWVGLIERLCLLALLLWVVVLAIALLRAQPTTAKSPTIGARALA